MSQEDTYRPAVLPSEAVMMPAVEETPVAPPPAAQEAARDYDRAIMLAQSHRASMSLERLRNRMRGLIPEGTEWISADRIPLDHSAARQEQRTVNARPMLESSETPLTRSVTRGAALSSLMRSAARQYSPVPALVGPQMPQRQGDRPQISPVMGQPQMRGALRHAVRSAQQPQQHPAVRPISLNNQR